MKICLRLSFRTAHSLGYGSYDGQFFPRDLPIPVPVGYSRFLSFNQGQALAGFDSKNPGYTVALRAVSTDDFMTAEWTRLPFEILEKAGSRTPTNEVPGVSRVVYDITSKPPGTVEWE